MAYYKVRIEVWFDWNPAESDLEVTVQPTPTRALNMENQSCTFSTRIVLGGIASQLVVRRTSAASCAASTDQNSGTQAILQGNFFNSGSGVASDDVQALLFFNHLPTDPAGILTAVAVLNWQGQFFSGTELGTINVGQRVSAQLTWDKRNHQFIARWTDLASGVVTKVSLPYTIMDTAPAAFADKLLGVRVFTPNCIGTQMLVDDVETTFDNVMVSGFDN
jgi:hypothetical protein